MSQKQYLWFVYSTGTTAAIAAIGATATATIQVAADAPFQMQQITLTVLQASLVVTNFGGTVNIEIQQQGRQISNLAIPTNAILLNGTVPYELKPYRLVPANSSILVTFTSPVATSTQFNLCFHGNKVLG